MLICRNAEGVEQHGQKKFGNPCPKPLYQRIVLTA